MSETSQERFTPRRMRDGKVESCTLEEFVSVLERFAFRSDVASWYCATAAEQIAALSSEITRLRAEREWQPIETAPKDGSVILAWGRGDGPGAEPWIEKICWWDALQPNDWDFDKIPIDAESCWTFDADGVKAEPEGWMPLPQPPAVWSSSKEPR